MMMAMQITSATLFVAKSINLFRREIHSQLEEESVKRIGLKIMG